MKKVSLFKNTEKKEGSSQPDYRMVASYQDDKGEWQNQSVGSFWLNNSDNPNAPKVSGNLSEAREFEGKSYPGYKIVSDGVSTPVDNEQPPVTKEDSPF